MKIYLAGKVQKNGWRTDILGHRQPDGTELEDPSRWPVWQRAIFDEHDYVGPYMFSCDHGCYHGPNQHGATAPIGGACDGGGLEPQIIVRCCLEAVRAADLVFCWVEGAGAEDYGSMFELGYAAALGRKVVVGMRPTTRDDHWFAGQATARIVAENPVTGLRFAIELVNAARRDPLSLDHLRIDPYAVQPYTLPKGVWDACGSPIEKSLMAALVSVSTRCSCQLLVKIGLQRPTILAHGNEPPIVVYPQRLACGHRADFWVESGKKVVVVECDGHEYHERSKKQAQLDRRLDRERQRAGFVIMRFTGAEIYRDAEGCAREVLSAVLPTPLTRA